MTASANGKQANPADRHAGKNINIGKTGRTYFFHQVFQGFNKNLFREAIVLLLLLFIVIAGLLLTDKDIILAPLMQLILLLYASYTGWSMFEKERQDGAEEYMLSLPITRCRLFLLKFIPRAVIILVLLGFYLLLDYIFAFPFLLDNLSFSITYYTFFLVSVAFSLSIKSFINSFFLVCLLTFGQVFFIRMVNRTISELHALRLADLTVLVFPILFVVLFRFYDIKPLSHFNRKFAPPAAALVVIILAVIYLTGAESWIHYIITDSGMIIRWKCEKTEILQNQGESWSKRFTYKGCVFPLQELEQKNLLYAAKREIRDRTCTAAGLTAVDLKTGNERQLFDLTGGWFPVGMFPAKFGKLIDGNYYLFMQSEEKKLQIMMTITPKEVKQVPISGELNGKYIYEFFHATRTPRLFFVLNSSSLNALSVVYQLDEKGASKRLFQVKALASWKEKLLVFDESGMTLYKVDGQGLAPVYSVKGKIKKMLRDGGTHETRMVVYKKDSAFYMLDLENENEPVKLSIKYPPFYYLVREGRYFLLHRNPQEIVISEVRDGKIINEEKWQPQIEFEYGQIWVSAYGVMVFNEQEYEVYPFKK